MTLHYGTDQPGTGPAAASFTVEQAIEQLGFGRMQLTVYLICKLIVATDAMEIMLLSLMGPEVQCDWQLLESQVAFISTAVFLGMAVSSPLVGMLADCYGRRTSLLITTLWTAYFGLLSAFSPSYVWLLLLRGLVGVGLGGVPQGYAMIAEYISSKYRAKMIVCGEVFWAGGSLFVIFLAAFVTPSLGWRWLVGLSALPVFLATIGCLVIPESVRYLMAAGRDKEAQGVLQKMSTVNNTALPTGTLVCSNKVALANVRDLCSAEYRRSTVLLWPIWFVISFAYYGVVLASPYLLSHHDSSAATNKECISDCNILNTDDYISLATSTVGEIVGLVFSFLLIDWLGRLWTWRLLMFASAIFLFLLQIPTSQVLTTFFLFGVRGATLTAFNLAFIYTLELYPTNMRALGLGVCTGWARLASMLTPFLAQILMIYSVPITVTIYGVMCVVATVFICFLNVETLGRPMMQTVTYTPMGNSEETETLADATSD